MAGATRWDSHFLSLDHGFGKSSASAHLHVRSQDGKLKTVGELDAAHSLAYEFAAEVGHPDETVGCVKSAFTNRTAFRLSYRPPVPMAILPTWSELLVAAGPPMLGKLTRTEPEAPSQNASIPM